MLPTGFQLHMKIQRIFLVGKSEQEDHVFCVFVRASDDLKNNMVAVDTMEQFQKELDQGKVSNVIPHSEQNVSLPAL